MVEKPLRLLLIEDNPGDVRLVQENMRERPYVKIQVAETLQDGLEILEDRPPDVILLDLGLPDSQGIDTVQKVVTAAPEVPVIVLTGLDDEEVGVSAVKAGAQDYLMKGQWAEQLLPRIIRFALERSEAQSELRRLNQELNQSRLLLQQTEQMSNVGGWEYSVKTRRISWSQGTYRIYCVDPETYDPSDIERNFGFYNLADQPRIEKAFRRCVEQGEPYDVELAFINARGEQRWVRTGGQAELKNGRVLRVFGNIMDITEQKHSELEKVNLREQLIQAQKLEAVGQLSGGMAHDFNNILTTILGNAAILLDDFPEDSALRRDIEEIQRAGERAASLIQQLLAFSRKQVFQPEVINLNDTVRSMGRMLSHLIRENIELKTVLSPDLGLVEADSGQIEQVIMNLMVNAGDAMPDGGKITIETKNVHLDDAYARDHIGVTPGSYVMLSVSDTGAGMTADVQAKVFEPFFTTKEKGKGTGLGLSTVYGIVKQSQGNIWLYSESGRGTTFKVYLPRVEKESTAKKTGKKEATVLTGSETVLVVEDDTQVRKLVVRSLQQQGYSILEAAKGEEAIELAAMHPTSIHLVLTDVVMPGIGSKEMVERLKSSRPEIKVLYMSGYTDNAIVHHGILDRGTAFLGKPFTQKHLTCKVREVLDEDTG